MKTYNDQFIATQFFILGIPLVPIKSYFQLKNGSIIELGINGKSVLKEYLSWFTFIPGLIALIGGRLIAEEFNIPEALIVPLGLVLIGFSIFFFFAFQRSSNAENEIRDLMESAIGMNILPEYFSYDKASDFQKQLIYSLKNTHKIDNWRDLTKAFSYTAEQLPLVFAITAFNKRLVSKEASQTLFERVKRDYKDVLLKK